MHPGQNPGYAYAWTVGRVELSVIGGNATAVLGVCIYTAVYSEKTSAMMYLSNAYRAQFVDRVIVPFDSSFRNLHSVPEFWSVRTRTTSIACLCLSACPRVGPGHPSFPPVHLYFLSFPPLTFPSLFWLYLFSFLSIPSLSIYQNSPTPFPGRRS